MSQCKLPTSEQPPNMNLPAISSRNLQFSPCFPMAHMDPFSLFSRVPPFGAPVHGSVSPGSSAPRRSARPAAARRGGRSPGRRGRRAGRQCLGSINGDYFCGIQWLYSHWGDNYFGVIIMIINGSLGG